MISPLPYVGHNHMPTHPDSQSSPPNLDLTRETSYQFSILSSINTMASTGSIQAHDNGDLIAQ